MIKAIVAIAQNKAIGRMGKLPWHYSADLKFFKRTTADNSVVMGFNTWNSIGKPLPNRLNIVLSRSNSIANQPNVILVRSKPELIALARYLKGDLFIIGGAKTYQSLADVIGEWIVTEIPESVADADTFMREGFLDDFSLKETLELEDELKVKTYSRKKL